MDAAARRPLLSEEGERLRWFLVAQNCQWREEVEKGKVEGIVFRRFEHESVLHPLSYSLEQGGGGVSRRGTARAMTRANEQGAVVTAYRLYLSSCSDKVTGINGVRSIDSSSVISNGNPQRMP